MMPGPSTESSAPARTTVRPPNRRIEVAEILDVAFAESGGHIDLSLRASDGDVVMLRVARATMAEVLARLPGNAVFVLETSPAEPPTKLNAPMGEWEIVQDLSATTPTLECRTADGHGVAVAFAYDPVTAIPQLQVAIDLRGSCD
jgi:hypothetical protein